MKPDFPELFDKKLSMLSNLFSPLLIDKGKLNDVGTLLVLTALCSSDDELKATSVLALLPVLSEISDILGLDESALALSGALVTGVC